MFDERLRGTKERVTARFAANKSVSPLAVSLVGLLFGLAAALAAARGLQPASVSLWIANRVCDGFDGELARSQQRTSHFGGYVDLLFDVIVYAAVPFGIAWSVDTRSIWIAYGIMVAAFYINTLSWNVIGTLTSSGRPRSLEQPTKHPAELLAEQPTQPGVVRRTSVAMPSGLIEGGETIVAYIVFLLYPSRGAILFAAFAILVGLTIVQRSRWAFRHL